MVIEEARGVVIIDPGSHPHPPHDEPRPEGPAGGGFASSRKTSLLLAQSAPRFPCIASVLPLSDRYDEQMTEDDERASSTRHLPLQRQ
jgi:hypothetical protein